MCAEGSIWEDEDAEGPRWVAWCGVVGMEKDLRGLNPDESGRMRDASGRREQACSRN